jgi:cytochrome c553
MRGLLSAIALACALAALSGSAAPFEERIRACLACHDEKAQSANPDVPLLNAQPTLYVLIQLYLFRSRQRIDEAMNAATKDFTDDDLRTFAEYISKLPAPQPATGPLDTARFLRGRMLVRQHRCDFCHNHDLAGRENVPRIAGQREDFLIKAMREYKSNVRPGYDASMANVLYPLSDADILDLAYFAARHP